MAGPDADSEFGSAPAAKSSHHPEQPDNTFFAIMEDIDSAENLELSRLSGAAPAM
jgi:hypothetical protein